MHASVNTATDTVLFCTGRRPSPARLRREAQHHSSTIHFIPFNKNTVITGNPKQWFNPLMFGDPAGAARQRSAQFPASAGIGQLEPLVGEGHQVGWLGEAGNVEFRAEVFNVANRANFQMLGIATTAASIFAGVTPEPVQTRPAC